MASHQSHAAQNRQIFPRPRVFFDALRVKTRDEGLIKNKAVYVAPALQLYLAIKNAGLRWRRGVEWTAAMGQFAFQFGDRFPGGSNVIPEDKTNRSRKPLTQNI